MEYYNNQLCTEAIWLVENEVLDYDQYKYLAKTKQLKVERRACRGTPALVSYESLPERLKLAVREVIGGDPYKAARVSQIAKRIEHDAELNSYFEDYKLADGRNLPKATRREYYSNAIILEAIKQMLSDKTAMHRTRGTRKKHKWDEIAEGVQELDRKQYPHSLPANERRLRDRFNLYLKEGAESLIHKNFLNKHAARVDDTLKESYMQELLSSPNNLDNAQVARLYNMIAGQMNWRKITSATVANYRDKMSLTIHAGRRGAVSFSNTKSMQAKRSAPTAPLLFWTLDGWDVELLYQATGKDGTTTYHNRPTVVVVLDACMKYPIGYAVGIRETPELIQEALRNAARHTAELFGSMHRAHQIQSDRYAIKKMTPFYEAIADKVTPARARNAKAKIIEPWFGYFNKKWCQVSPNWSGFGITSDRDKQPNIEYLSKYKTSYPDFEGVVQQIDMMIAREREELVEKYVELWNGLDKKMKIAQPKENYLLQFGETTGRTILMQAYGLRPTIMGQQRTYDCFDISFRDNASTKWRVMYDPEDLSQVLAVNEDESLQFVMEEKYIQPMALADRKEGDSEQLQRLRDYNKELKSEIIERRAISGTMVRNHMEQTGLIENETLTKLLITDSNGQHKNQKSAARLQIVAEDAKEIEETQSTIYYDKY